MKTALTRSALAALLLFSLSGRAAATTWFPKEFECPV